LKIWQPIPTAIKFHFPDFLPEIAPKIKITAKTQKSLQIIFFLRLSAFAVKKHTTWGQFQLLLKLFNIFPGIAISM
jgi:hypothetical protein